MNLRSYMYEGIYKRQMVNHRSGRSPDQIDGMPYLVLFVGVYGQFALPVGIFGDRELPDQYRHNRLWKFFPVRVRQ